MNASLEEFENAYGPVEPHSAIWQDFLDTDIKAVKRLCGLSANPPREGDLHQYLGHLAYVGPLQPDVFAAVLPRCLKAWQDDLMGRDAPYFAEHLHWVLSVHQGWQTLLLTPRQRVATIQFMRDSLLAYLHRETGLTLREESGQWKSHFLQRWFKFFASYGCVLPEVENFWQEWWSMRSPAYALAALQYACCLMYPDESNPADCLPTLWEYESLNYNSHWLPENVAFLRRILSLDYLRERIEVAAHQLEGEEEHALAVQMQDDLVEWGWLAESRMAELPTFLATPGGPWDPGWSL